MKRGATACAILLLAATLAWVQVRPAPPEPLTRYLPPGAPLVIEATDFAGLLAAWDASPEKAAWTTSDSRAAFTRSKLGLRLEEARARFAAAAGVAVDLELVRALAGGEAALGIYDIGGLRFLYIADFPAARLADSSLWRVRGDFEPRRAGERPYYVRSDAASGREVAFASADDRLLIATDGDLVARALQLLDGAEEPSVAAEPWYVAAVAEAGPRQILRMVQNLSILTRSPHFRTYWIQDNVSELRAYRAAVVDAERGPEGVVERRVLSRAGEPNETDSAGVGALARLVPAEAGLYRVWAEPSTEQALDVLRANVLQPERGAFAARFASAPRGAAAPGVVGSEADLDVRVDVAPAVASRPTFDETPLRGLLASKAFKGLLHVAASETSGRWIGDASVVVLEAGSAWDRAAVETALASSLAGELTISELGAAWVRDDDRSRWNGLHGLYAAVRGPYLAAADSEALLEAVLTRFTAPVEANPAVYVAGFRHGREATPFRTWMSRLDFTASGGVPRPNREPHFYSENLGGLSAALERVEEIRLTRRDLGARIEETIVYALRP